MMPENPGIMEMEEAKLFYGYAKILDVGSHCYMKL